MSGWIATLEMDSRTLTTWRLRSALTNEDTFHMYAQSLELLELRVIPSVNPRSNFKEAKIR